MSSDLPPVVTAEEFKNLSYQYAVAHSNTDSRYKYINTHQPLLLDMLSYVSIGANHVNIEQDDQMIECTQLVLRERHNLFRVSSILLFGYNPITNLYNDTLTDIKNDNCNISSYDCLTYYNKSRGAVVMIILTLTPRDLDSGLLDVVVCESIRLP